VKGVFKMECEVKYTNSNGTRRHPSGNASTNGATPPPLASRSSSGGSTKSQLHVDFIENGEVKEKREKYLTAKYGSHQMSLIRKRLAVEMWLYDELQKLFENEDGTPIAHEVEIDLDEVLDMDGDAQRRKFIISLLKDSKKSEESVNKFIDEVLEKAKTL